MKVSVNWIKEFTAAELPIDKLVEKIGAQLGAVEDVKDIGGKYKGILIAKVIECQKHPNADKLSLCLIDAGTANKEIKRNKDRLIQVVCGAPNVKAGQLVVWIPPGATVPNSHDSEPFVIEAREIRGQTSYGMLASSKELALGDNHEGILVLEAGKPGEDFARTVGLNDYVVDIENKMFTHRPDLFGILGIAREVAGIQHHAFRSPKWYQENSKLPADGRKNVLKLAINNDLPNLVRRFSAIVIKDVRVQPSPAWLQARLSAIGIRPINNIVDITNLLMQETAQPLHAYDYDKLDTGILGVRWSTKGESLELLGGKLINLEHEAIVITDGDKPIGLGGVMGGAGTQVDETSKNIVLECANFDMNTTRRSAMAYGLFTDAATRFTKNQSPRQNMAVLVKAVGDIKRIAGGRVASPTIDERNSKKDVSVVKTTANFINSRLGLKLSSSQIKNLLQNVEFKVETGSQLIITPPFWRTDVNIAEDIVEEVGRLYGYDHLPAELPPRNLAPAKLDSMLELKSRLRTILSAAGANEVLTYSFVHDSLIKKAAQDPAMAFHIKNALSPDLQAYRLSLTPSLLEKVHPNIKAGYDRFALYEIGKGHNQKMKDNDGLPQEFEMLSLVTASDKAAYGGAAFYQARSILDYLSQKLGIGMYYRPIDKEENYPVAKPFDPGRSAQIWDSTGKIPLGMVGEYKQSVISGLKLPSHSSGFEVGIIQMMQASASRGDYQTLNRFPSIEQDICLRISTDIHYEKLESFIRDQLESIAVKHGYGYKFQPIDIFQRRQDKNHKQATWRIRLWHPKRTLATADASSVLEILAEAVKIKYKAQRV